MIQKQEAKIRLNYHANTVFSHSQSSERQKQQINQDDS